MKKISANTKSIIIIDLSEIEKPKDIFWNDSIKMTVVSSFLKAIVNEATEAFKAQNLLNPLVVLDEAHRLASRERPESEELEAVRIQLRDATRTTRKYGLGWLFISQTISSLDREILNQLRAYFFGYGLGWGSELQSLKDILGGDENLLRLYRSFKDPQSGLGTYEYPFMTIGPISPLSFSGRPLFFNALAYPAGFLRTNFHI